MMAAVFGTMLGAFAFGRLGHRRIAVLCVFACLALAVWLFLFEIYSPEYGFGMPWISSELPGARPPGAARGA